MTIHHTFCWLAIGMVALVSAGELAAQDWLDPALNQPLPQYVPAGAQSMPVTRYPLEQPELVTTAPIQNDPLATDQPTSVLANPQLPTPRPLPSTPAANADIARPPAKPLATKKPVAKKRAPVIDRSIYRDYSAYPIDPRKPCSPCNGGTHCGCGRCKKLGNHGKPYQERELGGCKCGKQKFPRRHPQFSVYWPRPFSAKLDERNPQAAAARYNGCQSKRCVDVFDHLIDFKLVDYQRTDNGYCGPEADPYGCLGEQASLNAGIGYRVAELPEQRYPGSAQ